MHELQSLIAQSSKINFRKVISRPFPPLIAELLQSPLADNKIYSDFLSSSFSYKNLIVADGEVYDDVSLVHNEHDICSSILDFDSSFFHRKVSDAELIGNKLLKWSINISNRQNCSSFQIITEFKLMSDSFMPYLTFVPTVGEILESRIIEFLLSKVNSLDIAEEYAFQLTAPRRLSNHINEQIDFYLLALKKGITKIDIKNHLKHYAYFGFLWGYGKAWDTNFLESRIKNAKNPQDELDLIIANIRKLNTKREHVGQLIKEDTSMQELVDLSRRYVWLRSYRSEILNQAFANISTVLNRFYMDLGFNDSDYLYFTSNEIIEGRLVKPKEIEQRRSSFCLIIIDGISHYLSGDQACKFKNVIKNKSKTDLLLKGSVTCRSQCQISGRACIVNNISDLKSIHNNDIIISSMTTPHFVPFMKKASGIVTDEGGILCHAAIISREMNIPCIVGTKTATSQVRTGDVVNMDLCTGIVTYRGI